MNREFQVVFLKRRQELQSESGETTGVVDHARGFGEPMVRIVTADSKAEAESFFPCFQVIAVKDMGPALDPNQKHFTREQAAKYLQCSPSKIDAAMAAGELPKAKTGNPLFKREWLDAWARNKMTALAALATEGAL